MKKHKLKLPADQVAKEYWNLSPNERTYGKVCELLNIPATVSNQNYLSQLTREHEIAGLVKHNVLPPRSSGFADRATEYAPLLPELEDMLRRRFGLRDVISVNTSDIRQAPDVEWKEKHDDLLHQHLGRWSARILTSIVRPEDVVATGGGRGPYYCAHYCTIPPRNTCLKQVVSLTGDISARMWRKLPDITDDNATRGVDADHIASLLHSQLGTKLPPEYLSCAIADRKEGSGHKLKEPKSSDVTVAIVGIGSLAGGHRLKQEDMFMGQDQEIQELVKKINFEVMEVEKDTEPFFHCIGDVCNYYFVLDRVKDLPNGKSIYERLNEIVKKINDRFINTGPEELTRICKKGAVIAVAGGPHKIGAIAHVLKQNETGSPWITHLVTSDEVARSILKNYG